MPLMNGYIIRIYYPIESNRLVKDLQKVSKFLIEKDENFQKIIDLIISSAGIGLLDKYDNVYEISLGEEWFTPLDGSKPTKGKTGIESGGKVIVITTYALNMELDKVEDFIEKIVKIHPWEHPVIECIGEGGTKIWTPIS